MKQTRPMKGGGDFLIHASLKNGAIPFLYLQLHSFVSGRQTFPDTENLDSVICPRKKMKKNYPNVGF